MYLELVLDKSTDSGALAFEMMKRVVAYRQAESDPWSPDEKRAFHELVAAGQVAPPSKGSLAKYVIPASWPAGAGAQVAPPEAPSDLAAADRAELLQEALHAADSDQDAPPIQPEPDAH